MRPLCSSSSGSGLLQLKGRGKNAEMHQRHFLGGGWSRGPSGNTAPGTGVVRRAHPASGAQWNVQVVRGKVNGKCLWNACKALSLGLLLMVLGAAMATIGSLSLDLYTRRFSERKVTWNFEKSKDRLKTSRL